jgi:hypothetical protein
VNSTAAVVDVEVVTLDDELVEEVDVTVVDEVVGDGGEKVEEDEVEDVMGAKVAEEAELGTDEVEKVEDELEVKVPVDT